MRACVLIAGAALALNALKAQSNTSDEDVPMTDTPERELIEKAAKQIYATLHHLMRVTGTEAQDAYEQAARAIVTDLLSRVDKLEERVRALEDEIVDLWHESAEGMKDLHECLCMTAEEYARWANPDALNKNAS